MNESKVKEKEEGRRVGPRGNNGAARGLHVQKDGPIIHQWTNLFLKVGGGAATIMDYCKGMENYTNVKKGKRLISYQP